MAEVQHGGPATVEAATAGRGGRHGRSSKVTAVCLPIDRKGVYRPRKLGPASPVTDAAKTGAVLAGSVPTATETARVVIRSRRGRPRQAGLAVSQSGARLEGSLRSRAAAAIGGVSREKAAVSTTTIVCCAETAT